MSATMASQDINQQIETMVSSNDVVLFMKGTPGAPRCGFSAKTVEVLDALLTEYTTYDVLEDAALRQGIKAFSDWPTIPQLYVRGEMIGGCDIVSEMFDTGELEQLLGLPEVEPPQISITPAAQTAFQEALRDAPAEQRVHITISQQYQHGMDLQPPAPKSLAVQVDGLEIRFRRGDVHRAQGLCIDFVEGPQGGRFTIDNPNAPPDVVNLRPAELKARLETGTVTLLDVRTAHERAIASIAGSQPLDETRFRALLAGDRSSPLALYCHVGIRSRSVAEQLRQQGFTQVFNLAGGIDAWSVEVDPQVPRYQDNEQQGGA